MPAQQQIACFPLLLRRQLDAEAHLAAGEQCDGHAVAIQHWGKRLDAFLVINGTPEPSTPLTPGINVLSWSWGSGNAGAVIAQGPNAGTGLLFDAGVSGAITMMSNARGVQALDITETGLMSSGPMNLVSSFTGLLFNPSDTLTRTFMVTPNGGSPITLGSVTGGTTAGKVFTMPQSFTGPYAITESIVFNAVRAGDSFSVDDSVTTGVPEPATLGLLALGFAGVGFARRKRKN